MPPLSKVELASRAWNAFGLSLAFSTMALNLYGGLVLAAQVFAWLKQGVWYEVPLSVFFLGVEANSFPKPLSHLLPGSPISTDLATWLAAPAGWLGVHSMLTGLLGRLGVAATFLVIPLCIWYSFCSWSEPARLKPGPSRS